MYFNTTDQKINKIQSVLNFIFIYGYISIIIQFSLRVTLVVVAKVVILHDASCNAFKYTLKFALKYVLLNFMRIQIVENLSAILRRIIIL